MHITIAVLSQRTVCWNIQGASSMLMFAVDSSGCCCTSSIKKNTTYVTSCDKLLYTYGNVLSGRKFLHILPYIHITWIWYLHDLYYSLTCVSSIVINDAYKNYNGVWGMQPYTVFCPCMYVYATSIDQEMKLCNKNHTAQIELITKLCKILILKCCDHS